MLLLPCSHTYVLVGHERDADDGFVDAHTVPKSLPESLFFFLLFLSTATILLATTVRRDEEAVVLRWMAAD